MISWGTAPKPWIFFRHITVHDVNTKMVFTRICW